MKINDIIVQQYTQHIIYGMILWFVVATGHARVVVVFGIKAS